MLNGENVHHLRFGPQQKSLHPCLLNGAALGLLGAAFWQSPVPCETSDVPDIAMEGEAWLRAGDLTLRQLRLRLTYGEPDLRVSVDRTLLLTDINQPVQIAPPSEP